MSKQADIARQFDLPERQSKLNTMLREEGLRDEQVYCICRTSDVTRFMIGCDNCEEWYHGDCISVTEHEASKIRKFYCKNCRLKHPSLQIKYKEKRIHHHRHHREEKNRDEKKHKHDKYSTPKNKLDKRKDGCGECEACYIRDDCGRCENCKDMPKFGGFGKLKQKCKKRQCQNFYHMAKKRVEFPRSDHSYDSLSTGKSAIPNPPSNCSQTPPASVTESSLTKFTLSSKLIEEKLVSALAAASSSSSLSVKPNNDFSSKVVPDVTDKTTSAKDESIHDRTDCKSSVKALITISSSETNLHQNTDHSLSSVLTNVTNRSAVEETEEKDVLKEEKGCSPSQSRKNVNEEEEADTRKQKVWDSPDFKPYRYVRTRKRREQTVGRKRKTQRRDSDSDLDDSNLWAYETQVRQQCLGPQCVNAARPNSKYCCDECGLKLAEARIYSVLPQRIREWNLMPSKAEESDRKQLEKIRNQQLEARKTLQMLDSKHKELDRLLERNKAMTIDPQADVEGDEDGTEGAYVYCVTCGHEIPTRRAVKHMHSCFNKLESQMSFGSMFKTRIEGNNMFCDYYNASNHTYCKRLRVMCPEHTKEAKVSNTEVCGFPLTKNIFEETTGVCRASKKKCIKHYCWEKLRRATIDTERVKTCLKLDELVEQERQVRLAITSRAGVLGLMLHSTYDHEYACKIQQQHCQGDHQYHQQQENAKLSEPGYQQNDHHQHQSKEPSYTKENPYFSDHHYHRQDASSVGASKGTDKRTHSKLSPLKSSSLLANRLQPVQATKELHITYDHRYRGSTGGSSGVGSANTHHDHLYFSSQQSRQPSSDSKKLHDHLYYSSKKHK